MSDLKIETEQLIYRKDLALDLFDKIEQSPYAMLLRSASDNHPNSRYDILVHSPQITVETYGGMSNVTIDGESSQVAEDPFELLRRLQQQYLPHLHADTHLPFIGGWLGYFAYDLGRRIEAFKNIAKQDLSAPDMAVGLYEKALVVDHELKQAFWVGKNLAADNMPKLNHESDAQHPSFQLETSWSANMTKQQYQDKFEAVQDYLLSGDCYQINLAQRFSAGYSGNEWPAYKTLENENKAPFSAFIRLPHNAVLSISPERFLLAHDKQVQTKPIKGTRPRFNDPLKDKEQRDDLQTAEKDQAENLMIVDLLRNDIGRVSAPGSVKVPHLFEIESFPAVHHLVSTITGVLDEQYDEYDLLRACFPGGSITGAPKVRAMQIIEELEPHRRSVYCGSIGYISRCGNMDTSITIRTLITEDNKIHAWAGGGLVADSECESEYQETLHKLGKILPVLE
ncbi:aminodeoxychorismate synthase component I [Vibrio comitans]|uniref:aminodeoxychorismate synthase n=1 Tax=Vibrio comitans NBRC 102076 TaxID=1219078 RepID=A0A4Y3IKB0_9VIBR|nr:aminodeoxychorismate synthase component I [Vibrio comitans]GEA59953.1 aminodeoxychorismate synthase, component I [Vibrio comitans NBRC 102076]